MKLSTMRELSLEELEVISGGKNAQDCKTAITQGTALGALVGAAIGAPARVPQLGAVVGGLIGGAFAGKNSPACRDGSDYCKDGGNY